MLANLRDRTLAEPLQRPPEVLARRLLAGAPEAQAATNTTETPIATAAKRRIMRSGLTSGRPTSIENARQETPEPWPATVDHRPYRWSRRS